MKPKELRPHQELALNMLRRSLSTGHKRPMLHLSTGAGKSLIAANIVKGALAKGNRVCFTVPATALIDQTVKVFGEEGIHDVGVIQAQHPLTDYSKPVQVASVQTLARRNMGQFHFDVVVVDEAHLAFKSVFQWMQDWSNIPFIGLSATPYTRGLGKYYDDLLQPITMRELIDQGYLCDYRVFASGTPDLSKVRTTAGDYNESDLGDAMTKGTLVADIVSTWQKLGEDRQTIAFCATCAHANQVHEQFTAAGIKSAYVDGYTDDETRTEIFKGYADGDIRIIVNVGVLVVGFDSVVDCILYARPTKSEMRYVQSIGRGLRVSPCGRDLIILDHSSTTERLGFVEDIHRDELCDGKPKDSAQQDKEKEEKLPKSCPSCAYMKPVGEHTCSQCGFEPKKRSDIETVSGELQEITQKKKLTAAQKRGKAATKADKQQFYSELLTIAYTKRRSRKWVGRTYRDFFGCWPRGLEYITKPPSPETESFVKAKMIKFAKGKGRAA